MVVPLCPWFFLRGLAEAASLLSEAVCGGWIGTVGAVHIEATLQFGNLLCLLCNLYRLHSRQRRLPNWSVASIWTAPTVPIHPPQTASERRLAASASPRRKNQGHKGTTIGLPCSSSETLTCHPEKCTNCASFGQCHGNKAERRYEIDAKVSLEVREYVQMEYLWPKSKQLLHEEFPSNITSTKQYDKNLRGLIVTLNSECAVSFNKIHHFLKELLKLSKKFILS